MSNLTELATRLERLNLWRRGGDFDMPCVKEIGNDIDSAVEAIRELELLRNQNKAIHTYKKTYLNKKASSTLAITFTNREIIS